MQRCGKIQKVGGFLVDVDASAGIGTGTDAGDQTVIAIVRVLDVQAVDFGLRERGGRTRVGCVRGFQVQLQGQPIALKRKAWTCVVA